MKIQILIFFLGVGMSSSVPAQTADDFDKLWNYGKPAETEVKFRALLPAAQTWPKDLRLQLMTQIARTHSLRNKFEEAHQILDEVKPQLSADTPVAELRYLLERGRSFNSAKRQQEALPQFLKAYELGLQRKQDNLAIDAAHMMGIAEKETAQQIIWNLKAIELAEKTQDPKARKWLASLTNNLGWAYHDQKEFSKALEMFQKATPYFARAYEELSKDDWFKANEAKRLERLKTLGGR